MPQLLTLPSGRGEIALELVSTKSSALQRESGIEGLLERGAAVRIAPSEDGAKGLPKSTQVS